MTMTPTQFVEYVSQTRMSLSPPGRLGGIQFWIPPPPLPPAQKKPYTLLGVLTLFVLVCLCGDDDDHVYDQDEDEDHDLELPYVLRGTKPTDQLAS